MASDVWKMRDARARFAEVVRRAQAGEPQRITLHGKEAVIVADPKRYEVRPRANAAGPWTMRDFLKACEKYRGAVEGIDFESRVPMNIDTRNAIFDKDEG
jgi:prevent-host-death family protein